MLFMLHGYGSNEEDLFGFAPDLPEELFIVSIRAPHALQPFGYAWYAIHFEAEKGKWNDVPQAVEARKAVLDFMAEAIEAYDLDASRVNLLGFSQGSIISYTIALLYPERIQSLVALSGYIDPGLLGEDFKPRDYSGLSIYASHGQMDMVIPPEWAQQAAEFLEELGIDHVYEEYPVGHGVSPANFHSFLGWLQRHY